MKVPVRLLRRHMKKCLLLVPVVWFSVFVISFYVEDFNNFSNRLVKTYQIENSNSNADYFNANDAILNTEIALNPNNAENFEINQNIKQINEGPNIDTSEDYDDDDLDELMKAPAKQLARPLPNQINEGLQIVKSDDNDDDDSDEFMKAPAKQLARPLPNPINERLQIVKSEDNDDDDSDEFQREQAKQVARPLPKQINEEPNIDTGEDYDDVDLDEFNKAPAKQLARPLPNQINEGLQIVKSDDNDDDDSDEFEKEQAEQVARPLPKQIKEGPQILTGEEKDGEIDESQLEQAKQLAKPLLQPDGPGEKGAAVKIDKEQLTEEQRLVYDKGWKKNAFNQYVSDMISLHRTLPDPRPPENISRVQSSLDPDHARRFVRPDLGPNCLQRCTTIDYGHSLPETCVIIIFHNEAWSVLLRTVHSVLDRSPQYMLKEIILVDDFSDFDHLKSPLEDYVNKLSKVQLLRAHERSGLIRARLLGFERCTAPVAVFLDSHCEAAEGWLEPLVSRIAESETNVAVPIIDVINDDTFEFTFSSGVTSIGGFNWELLFTWHGVPEAEKQRNEYKNYLPIRSPTMAGGLFAISADYFRKIGKYDTGMDIWGGENLELSFKTWMCGGTLEIVPCSHVGHVFRSRSPFTWTKGQALSRNLARLAEVWMDDFKFYYYERSTKKLVDYGDVSDRKELRTRLQCKDFKWYLNNIYPELFIPSDILASGEIRNAFKPFCADAKLDQKEPVIGYPCHGQGTNQYWMLTKENEIRRDSCWDSPDGRRITIYNCHGQRGNQVFMYMEDDTIRSKTYNKCVELSLNGKEIYLAECNKSPRQQWKWNRKPMHGPTRDQIVLTIMNKHLK